MHSHGQKSLGHMTIHLRKYCSSNLPSIRVITRSSYDTSASILLNRLSWHNLSTQRKKLKATLMFKIIKGLSPEYLQDLFSIRSTKYNLRDSEIKLNLPKPRTNYCKRALGYSGALFNNNIIRPVARKGYRSIAHEAKPNGLLTCGP